MKVSVIPIGDRHEFCECYCNLLLIVINKIGEFQLWISEHKGVIFLTRIQIFLNNIHGL